jgi:hypothetical protein
LQIARNNSINLAIEQLCLSFAQAQDKDNMPTKTKGIKKGRMQKREGTGQQLAKEEMGEQGSSCFGKSGSQSTVLLEEEGRASGSD